jgi:hypothetical protein
MELDDDVFAHIVPANAPLSGMAALLLSGAASAGSGRAVLRNRLRVGLCRMFRVPEGQNGLFGVGAEGSGWEKPGEHL